MGRSAVSVLTAKAAATAAPAAPGSLQGPRAWISHQWALAGRCSETRWRRSQYGCWAPGSWPCRSGLLLHRGFVVRAAVARGRVWSNVCAAIVHCAGGCAPPRAMEVREKAAPGGSSGPRVRAAVQFGHFGGGALSHLRCLLNHPVSVVVRVANCRLQAVDSHD